MVLGAATQSGVNPNWQRLPSVQVCGVECGGKCCYRAAFYITDEEHDRLFPDVELTRELWWIEQGQQQHGVAETGGFINLRKLGGCPHLTPENLCGVYEQRPGGCRSFPDEPTRGCLVWPLL